MCPAFSRQSPFQPNDAATDDGHFLGYFLDLERAGAVNDFSSFIVDRHRWQFGGHASGGDDNVLCLDGLCSFSIVELHVDIVRANDFAVSLNIVDAILFEECVFDADWPATVSSLLFIICSRSMETLSPPTMPC